MKYVAKWYKTKTKRIWKIKTIIIKGVTNQVYKKKYYILLICYAMQ